MIEANNELNHQKSSQNKGAIGSRFLSGISFHSRKFEQEFLRTDRTPGETGSREAWFSSWVLEYLPFLIGFPSIPEF
jgi:hypothetical protein